MPADIQSIALLMTLSAASAIDITPPVRSRVRVNMTKKVWAAFPAVSYVFFGRRWGRKSLNMASLKKK